MSEFKVGDEVKVVELISYDENLDVTFEYQQYLGAIGEIVHIIEDDEDNYPIGVLFRNYKELSEEAVYFNKDELIHTDSSSVVVNSKPILRTMTDEQIRKDIEDFMQDASNTVWINSNPENGLEGYYTTIEAPKLKQRFLHEVSLIENPQLLSVAVKLPTGAIEVITNTQYLKEKIEYYTNAYDNDFKLNANSNVQIVGYMIV